ncbi:MAG TPA: hypothetical protein VMH37_08685 [Candidatus Binataceae bacterium]|nr:hypothetical protein [Candidatus Binataceae bacterium]
MPDLGNRANVMGPQPIGPIKQPAPEMMAAIDRFLDALMAGHSEEALVMAGNDIRDKVSGIADALKGRGYGEKKILGKARVGEHYFVKARLSGSKENPFTFQFRIGPDGSRWIVKEAANLSDVRSAWTK